MYKLFFAVLLLLSQSAFAQKPRTTTNSNDLQLNNSTNNTPGQTGPRKDSLGFEHRDDAKDSVNISYRFIDSIRNIRFDSTIDDFYKYFSMPVTQQYLGNNGTAGYSLVFTPFTKIGFDPGFHAFDAYRITLENARMYRTTKPFTQLNYQLASGQEQMIKIVHTQNPKPNLNVGFDYRLISAPGFFVTQNTNTNNYRLFSNYTGKRKRYAFTFMMFGNSMKSSENGGIQNDSFLTSPNYARRYNIPVNLGTAPPDPPNPFKSSVSTGNIYKEFTFFLRQSYDLGKKDSIEVNDSTMDYLFYSKLRFQHTFTYRTGNYRFNDYNVDSAFYKNWYDTTIHPRDSFIVSDRWKISSNDFSILQFPDTKNLAQYLLAGARLENISGTFSSGSKNYYNIILHGEYRNKTRNRLWDIQANGEFYLNGLNSGDYSAYAMLSRYLNKKWGNVRLSFQNVNRSPSFIYNTLSSFNFHNTSSYSKENITVISASADNPFVSLSASNSLITNYMYFANYDSTAQYSKVINLLQLSASKKIKLTKRWSLYTEVCLQQVDGAAPIKVPLLFTRNRIAYEGIFFKNLGLSTGVEFRYYTPFKGYNYSPVMGKFTPQDSVTINNRPDITGFVHFRIRTFTAYIRAENLNSISFTNGFGFTKNNFAAPHYVYPGLLMRFGIQWNFVN